MGALDGARVGLVGGGVAGLVLALACARRGARVEVFEQAPEMGEVGAGLQISANGVRVLRALGLTPEQDLAANRPENMHVLDMRAGIRLMSSRPGAAGPFLQVHRADLVDWLAAKAREAGVEVQLGARVSASALPGGPHRFVASASGVRSVAHAGPAPEFTGQVAWRALVPAQAVPGFRSGDTHVFIGPHRHLVVYPLRDGTLLNLVGVQDGQVWDGEGWDHPGEPEAMRAAFRPFAPRVGAALDAVTEVRRWALYTHPEVRMIGAAGHPLVGDAAQAMLPFMAQGAVMAMEDAWTLAAAWDAGTALDEWAAKRARRRAAVARTAVMNGRIFHASHPLWVPFHRIGMWGLGRLWPGLIDARARWIYDHDVTATS